MEGIFLLHIYGLKCFEYLRTYCCVVYNTFLETCHGRDIAADDSEWQQCFEVAKNV